MKHFFNYEKGFVNIDDKNLYLTPSGNWSETDTLSEKSSKSKSQYTKKKIKTYSFYAMLLSFSLLLFFNLNNGRNGKLMLTLGIILLFLSAFYYIRSSSKSHYKIPLLKINKMEYSSSSLNIYFKNLEDKDDFEKLDTIDKKGVQILKDLNLIK